MFARVSTAVRAGRYLGLVRGALPRWLRVALAVWLVLAVFAPPPPFDAGVTELLGVVVGVAVWVRHRPLLSVCWHAASQDVRL